MLQQIRNMFYILHRFGAEEKFDLVFCGTPAE